MNSDSRKSDEPRTYTQEFRDEAVRLTVTSGKPVAQISRAITVTRQGHNWSVYQSQQWNFFAAPCEIPLASIS
jgi:transposase-like protein